MINHHEARFIRFTFAIAGRGDIAKTTDGQCVRIALVGDRQPPAERTFA